VEGRGWREGVGRWWEGLDDCLLKQRVWSVALGPTLGLVRDPHPITAGPQPITRDCNVAKTGILPSV